MLSITEPTVVVFLVNLNSYQIFYYRFATHYVNKLDEVNLLQYAEF